MSKLLILVLCMSVLTAMGGQQSCDARTLQTRDYLELQSVRTPQISPDGKMIVYVRTKVNALADSYDDELWIMDADGKNDRPLMRGGAEVHWSPDSTRIAYLDKTDHGNEIFLRWMAVGGGTTQITFQGQSPFNLSWSPDGRSIAYLARVPTTPSWGAAILGSAPKGARWTADPVIIDQLHYRLDGVGYTNDAYSHIFVVSAEDGIARQLTSGAWNAEPLRAGSPAWCGDLEWTPDSKSVLFSANMSPSTEAEDGRANLHVVDVADGHIRNITQGKGFWGMLPGPKISPDGRLVAYFGRQASTSNYPSVELHVIGVDGTGERTLIADVPGWVNYLQWDRNGQVLYYVTGIAGTKNVYTVSLSGRVGAVTTGPQSVTLSSTSNDGIAAGTLSTAYSPPEVVRLNLHAGRDLHALTAVNQSLLAQVQLGRVEEVWYTSSDNTKVQGWIVYPPDFDPSRKYPLVLNIHGGPEWMYEGDFDFTFQDMAAQGYVVLFTNPRGSIGYGGAFARTIYDTWPGRVDYEDLMSGVDMVVGRGFVDPTRLYVQGCSGGGTLTAWVVTQTDRFAGAAAMCSISNMISFADTSDITSWVFNRYQKPFWEDPTAWLATSSIMKVNRVKTPTLVIVGEHDIRTPVAQSEELYTGLKMVGVPTKLILFREEAHGTEHFKPSNVMRLQLYLRKWYEEWHREIEDGKPVWRHH